MNNSLLAQQLFPELGSKQFTQALEMFLTTYAEFILGFIFVAFVCAAGLALIEKRQHPTSRRAFSANRQKGRQPKSRATGYDLLSIELDSLF